MASSVLSINELISASKSGDVDYVRQFKSADLQNWKSDELGSSALAIAAGYSNSSSVCEEILNRCHPSLLYKINNSEVTALHAAAYNNNSVEVLKFLLSASTVTGEVDIEMDSITTHDDNNNKLLLMQTASGKTALHIAVERGNLELAKVLTEADPSKKLLKMTDRNGDTGMHTAVKKHNLNIVTWLIQADPDFEYPNNVNGQTPLFIAFQEGLTGDGRKVEIRKLLIEKQPSQCDVPIGMAENKWTLLHHAAHKGDLSTIEDIIKFWPERCLENVDIHDQNFLHIAVKYRHIEVVTYILESLTIAKEILNGQDSHGNTPLHIAAMRQDASIAICLLYDSRVSKEIMNMQGLKAIDMIHFDYDKRKVGSYGLGDRVGEKEIKEQTDYDLLVGALIATGSFTVGITLPGGYTSDSPNKGTAALAQKPVFKVFVITNTIAFLLSLYAVFCHFCVKHLHKKEDIIFRLKVARICSFCSIFAMVFAFMAGSCVVLFVTEGLSITVGVLCCFFVFFAIHAVWVILDKPSLLSACKIKLA